MTVFREPEESMVLMGTPPRGARPGPLTPGVKNQTPVKTKPSSATAGTVDLLCSDTPEGKAVGPRGESIYRYVPVYVCQAIYNTLF